MHIQIVVNYDVNMVFVSYSDGPFIHMFQWPIDSTKYPYGIKWYVLLITSCRDNREGDEDLNQRSTNTMIRNTNVGFLNTLYKFLNMRARLMFIGKYPGKMPQTPTRFFAWDSTVNSPSPSPHF